MNHIKEKLETVLYMAKVNKFMLVVIFTMVNGSMVRDMVMDSIIGLTEVYIKVNIGTIIEMAKVSVLTLKVFTMVNGLMVKNMDMDSMIGLTEVFIKVNGNKI